MSSEVNAAAEVGHHAATEALTPTAYIAEHLQNLNNIGGPQQSIIDFSVIHLDTMFWTTLMGLIAVLLLVIAALHFFATDYSFGRSNTKRISIEPTLELRVMINFSRRLESSQL